MFRLVVLSALVAVSVAAPSGLVAPLAYSNIPLAYSSPSLTVVQTPAQAVVSSVPTSISSQSSTVLHGSKAVYSPSIVQVNPAPIVEAAPIAPIAPIVEVKAAPAIVGSVPTSVSSYSSSVVHGGKAIVAAAPVASYAPAADVEIIETAPAVEVRTAPLVSQAAVLSVPSQSSSVVHGSGAVVSAPLQYAVAPAAPVLQYSAAPALQYAAAPALQYAAAPALQYAAAPALQYAAAPIAAPLVSSYSGHGLVASPVANVW